MEESVGAVAVSEAVECPLCLGKGQLQRSEILERLGMKDYARVAQLSAQEAFSLLLKKQTDDEVRLWARFDTELTKRIAEVGEKHSNELQTTRSELGGRIKELEAEKQVFEQQKNLSIESLRVEYDGKLGNERSKNDDTNRRLLGSQGDITKLTEEKQKLEAELAKVARVGRREEMSFQEEARTWPGVWISDKLSRYGDYLLAYRDPSGESLDPRMVIDNKDKDAITEDDVSKLVRDAKEQKTPIAVLLAHEEQQLRQGDREQRWSRVDGVWILRTTRAWLPRDLEILKPLLERMRVEGPDFLERNADLAREVKRSFEDLDKLDVELNRASRAIEASKALVVKYRDRLQALCDASSGTAVPKAAAP